MIPHRIPFFLPWLYPQLTWRLPATTNTIYLTFDDGPVPGPTEFVLETLHRYAAKATFFCIGDNVRKHPEVFAGIVANGHAIGNHTFNHLNGWKTPLPIYLENVLACERIMGIQAIGRRLFRPPYGRITRKQIGSLHHYNIVMWDVLSADYNVKQSPEACLRNTIRAVRAGSVVVFHDSFKAERNLRVALPGMLEYFHGKGFSFDVIPS